MQTQEKHSQAAVLGLQHLLAMYSGSILVPIMIATALGYSAEQLTYLISTDIFMCGVATFLQLQLNKYFGIGLPVVLGVAFQSVAPLIMIGQSHGSGAMFGALAQIIPSSVLGGAMLVMFGFVSIQGMQILARVDFANNEHNFLIAAVSIAAGVGLNNSNLFVSMPTAFQMFFSNGIVVASLLAIVLNAVLNHKKK
ncbi:TPA: solute carrier family 23 protein [Streptococcus pneumoniae]